MILSGNAIEEAVNNGRIIIEPFNESQLNPNSYNLRLSPELLVYKKAILDMKKDNEAEQLIIPNGGLILWPGQLYLGKTEEYTATNHYVPMLEGRSSVGRLGMFIHVTAGFGDIGFAGCWTLEIMVAKPLRIYAGTEICQIYYHTVAGDTDMQYTHGKYSNAECVQPSRMWRDFR